MSSPQDKPFQWQRDLLKQCPPPPPPSPVLQDLLCEDRAATGCSQFPIIVSSPGSLTESSGLEDSSSEESQASSIGNSFLDSQPNNPFDVSKQSLEPISMQNLPSVKQQRTMSGKIKLRYKVPDSNLARKHSNDPARQTGNECGILQSPVTSLLSQPPFEFLIMGLSERLSKTIFNRILKCDVYRFSGARLELGKVAVRGTRRVFQLILRLPLLNSGTGTKVSQMLLSMNFEELSKCPTFCDGWIGTRSLWKSKVLPPAYVANDSGSPPIYHPATGIQL